MYSCGMFTVQTNGSKQSAFYEIQSTFFAKNILYNKRKFNDVFTDWPLTD